VIVLKAGAAATNATITLNPTYVATGATPGSVTMTGVYDQLGQTTSFSVASDATIVWYTVTSNIPATTLSQSTTNQAISNVTITEPAGVATPIGGTIGTSATGTFAQGTGTSTLTAISPTTVSYGTVGTPYPSTQFSATGTDAVTSWSASGVAGLSISSTGLLTGTPTTAGTADSLVVTATTSGGTATETYSVTINSAPTIVLTLTTAGDTWAGTPSVTQAGSSTAPSATASGTTLTVTVGSVPPTTTSTFFQLSNLEINTGTNTGAAQMSVAFNNYTGTALATGSPVTIATGVTVGSTLGTSTQIYGADGTADGTVAAEFESAFPANASTQSGGNSTVVLATDVQPYDALSAAYLEGQLGTGLLITPPTSFGADAMSAMRIEGVQSVYVVGGPLAVSPAVISQIEATPAYKPGGLVQSGSNIKVITQIYGATAADTAQSIATHFGTSIGTLPVISGAYSAASGTTGGGMYNDTLGSSSATGPASVTPTAIVISETDWQDAMSVAPEAYAFRIPVILTPATSLGTQASAALTSLGVKQVLVIGGQLAVTNAVVSSIQALNGGVSVLRIAGQDATDTAGQLAEFALSTGGSGTGLGWTSMAALASHANYWSDALGAAALGGGANASFGDEPIILVESPTVVGTYAPAALTKLAGSGISKLNVLGGPLAMPTTTVNSLLAAIAAG
jgi:putative cell wall-binding protein